MASHKEQMREKILSASLESFLENGFHGTSMRNIAQRAGVALGNIYNYFPSKEQIFMAILLKYHPAFEILPALQSAQGKSTEDLVRDAAHRMVTVLESRVGFLNLMFIELVEFKSKHLPTIFELVFPKVLDYAQSALQNRNDLRPIPLPIILRAFIGLFFSYVATDLLFRRQDPYTSHPEGLNDYIDIYLHGVLAN